MNLLHKFFYLFVCIATIWSGYTQQVNPNQLSGSWVFNYEVSTELMVEAAKAHLETMDANELASLEQAYQGRRITFFENGVFVQEISNGQQAEANWQLNLENEIVLTNISGHKLSFKILEISNDHMILAPIQPDDSMANMLFSQWYLMKG